MKKIRVLIADDHNIVRQSIVSLIESSPDMLVVAEAEDGQKIIEKYFHFKPDVVITDISMPRMNGLEAAKTLLAKNPSAKIIFLSIYNTDEYIYKTLKVGAMGLIGKDILKGELLEAIRTVAAGEKYFTAKSEEELEALLKRYDEFGLSGTGSKMDLLNHREKEVLKYISQGLTSEEIAIKLYVSKRTVDVTRISIMNKLGIKTAHQLIRFAVEYAYKNKESF